jgi:hypothetical protein
MHEDTLERLRQAREYRRVRIQLSVPATRTLAEIAEAEHRSVPQQASHMLEEYLETLREADPEARYTLAYVPVVLTPAGATDEPQP